MRIGIVGAGHIGGTAAKLFAKAGHQVGVRNSRGPATLASLPASTFRRASDVRIRFRKASDRLRYPPSRTSRSNAFRSGPSRDTPIRATGMVDLGTRKTPGPQEGHGPFGAWPANS